MALKGLVLESKIKARKKELADFIEKRSNIAAQIRSVEEALNELDENSTEEERKAVEDRATEVDELQTANEADIEAAETDIQAMETELAGLERKNNDAISSKKERSAERKMHTRKFYNLSSEERDRFFADEEVKSFLTNFREKAKNAISQQRDLKGGELLFPVTILDLIKENVIDYSKLLKHIRLRNVNGTARQNVMGSIPEAVWTEACASLNELDFSFNQVEVDSYKVGGIIYVCKSTIEDSDDFDLASEIIEALLISRGIAIDKAILYGTGIKMPLGIVTRLAQDSQPSNYPQKARPWEDLRSHLVTIESDKTGLEFFKAILNAGGLAKSKYSRGVKFWAMNETTFTTIKSEALNFNAAGNIVSIQNGVMPVIGGPIEVLSDDIISDGNIVAGYGDLYLLSERGGSSVERSDEYRFAEDQVAFKATSRYDGVPVIAEGFIAIGIGSAPVESAVFIGDTANDASLSSLSIGDETLSPAFDAAKYNYTVTASAASGQITAAAKQSKAHVSITYDGKPIVNGTNLKFTQGTKDLVVTVTNGVSKLVYTVAITKS